MLNDTQHTRGSGGDGNWERHFEGLRTPPPDDLVERVMSSLPEEPGTAWGRLTRRWWPASGAWLAPALAGAAVAVLVMGAIITRWPAPGGGVAQTGVTFVVHAPAAEHVELVGSFNDWQRGQIELAGPDATGRWTATVSLPEGRHEYMFLVDGERWVSDPYATFYRDDGFGNLNGVIDVESESS